MHSLWMSVIYLCMRKLNLVSQKYNRLLVLEEAPSMDGRTAWRCQCDCGTIKIVKTDNLRDGSTKSCGCWNDEQRSSRAKNMFSKNIKFTPSETSARRVWRKQYSEMDYNDFYLLSQQECFYCGAVPANVQNSAKEDKKSSIYAKENGYFKYNGLDRIDNTKPHSKENCVPCCKYCNYSKRERTTDEFKAWIIRAYNTLTKV